MAARRTTVSTNSLTPTSLALEALAGPTLVLDASLRLVDASSTAASLLGHKLSPSTSIVGLLCPSSLHHPLVEALTAGRAIDTTVTLAAAPQRGSRARSLRVRATPLFTSDTLSGWLLHLQSQPVTESADSTAEPDGSVVFHGMSTRDPGMKHMFHIVRRAARRDVPVLVRGETGSGKELVARAIHTLSPRFRGPFRAVNCAALPAALLESELFGHVKGSFTGATQNHPGIFRLTDHGTLFLDELAELPIELQAKLLRAIETRTVIPVGATEPVTVDVRLVAATHQSLRRAVDRGTFRADLMYRLRVVPIFLPPLRARRGDITLLTHKLVAKLNSAGERKVDNVAQSALSALERYPWPGNVRELQNALEYAFVIGEGPTLTVADLPPEIAHYDPGMRLGAQQGLPPEAPVADSAVTPEATEAQKIRRALSKVDGNRSRAAESLGISRVTLWRRMQALGLGK